MTAAQTNATQTNQPHTDTDGATPEASAAPMPFFLGGFAGKENSPGAAITDQYKGVVFSSGTANANGDWNGDVQVYFDFMTDLNKAGFKTAVISIVQLTDPGSLLKLMAARGLLV